LAPRTGLILTALIFLLYAFGNSLLDTVELKTYDMRLRAFAPAPGELAVAIVAIDEPSLAELGRWPWSRATLARLVDTIDRAGARAIVFDVFLSEPENAALLEQLRALEALQGFTPATSPYGPLRRALGADARLAEAIRRSGKVVLPVVFLMSAAEARHESAETAARAFDTLRDQAVPLVRSRAPDAPGAADQGAAGVVINLPELHARARSAGHINSIPDADGSVRWAPLVLRYRGEWFPSADVQAARLVLGGGLLALDAGRFGIERLRIGDREFATDDAGRALIRYRGVPGSFPTHSADAALAGKLPREALAGKIVLIGATAQGLGDIRVSPFAANFPGVEIRANTIQNLLDDDFIARPGWAPLFELGLLLVLGVALSLWLPRLSAPRGALVIGLALAAYLAIALTLFARAQLWLNLVYPALLLALLFVATNIHKYLAAEAGRRQLKGAFQHYVPAAVVEEIVQNRERLALGGDKRELTVLFADIRGFTGLAETLAPEELVGLLNRYLTVMTEQVFRHDGLLDKYMGDALMAVYGAPLKHPDHARLACRTAVDMMRALVDLKTEWAARGLPPLDMGIGINTGPMVVGNMGSQERFDYTVIGDAVNLASRIEALNKTYGTHILVSEFTYEQVRDEFPRSREVDVAAVRGRAEPVRLYELLLPGSYPDFDWLPEFQRGYELFRADLRPQARAAFEKVFQAVGDPVSQYYVNRCQAPRRRRGD